jgi:hypothetical protein
LLFAEAEEVKVNGEFGSVEAEDFGLIISFILLSSD